MVIIEKMLIGMGKEKQMFDSPKKENKDKNIAIVGMGKSQIDFHLSQVHSVSFDEIWAISACC